LRYPATHRWLKWSATDAQNGKAVREWRMPYNGNSCRMPFWRRVMSVMIGQSVGERGANKPNDLIQIDGLLRQVRILGSMAVTDRTRIEAIKRFQQIWRLQPDGRIDPNGMALRRLNETASPLKLSPTIALDKIDNGGYKISFAPKAPPKPYQTWLGVSTAPNDYLDVTECNHIDVMTRRYLMDLLKLVERRRTWAPQTLSIRLFVLLDNQIVTESTPQVLPCPVQPLNGDLLPLDEQNNGPKLTYQGAGPNGPFYGRKIRKLEGLDGYFFTQGGVLETAGAYRGFDCVTYAAATCGVPVSATKAWQEGPALAEYLGATACYLEKPLSRGVKPPAVELKHTDPQNVKDFFESRTAGYFIMICGTGIGHHVVLVANGTVHEFAFSKEGYKATPVQEWLGPYQAEKLTVCELPSRPALAN
jgi:hypothetical protein